MTNPATTGAATDTAERPLYPDGLILATAVAFASPVLGRITDRLGPGVRVVDLIAGDTPPDDGPLVALLTPRIDLRVLDRADRAEWVHFLSTGIDGFPLGWLNGRTATCARGTSSPAIAQYVVTQLLAAEQRLPGIWGVPTLGSVTDYPRTLTGSTVGLLGLGSISLEVVRLLQPFGADIIAARRSSQPSPVPGVTVLPSLDDVLAAADHLVVTAPLTPQTDGLLDDRAFGVAKPGLHVANISRGRLIDTDALLRALESGRVGRASLDVTEPEPLPADHPLRAHPRAFITPHISWSAPDTHDRSVELFLDNLRRWTAGEALRGTVDQAAGY